MKIKSKKGFTLIEVLTVIAIFGILVLLASPRFLGYTEQAKLAQIKNDIKVHENHIDSELTRNEFYIENWKSISSNTLNSLKVENKVYDKRGLLESNYEFKGEEYYEIPRKLVNTKLKGEFVLSKDEKVYYFDSKQSIDEENPLIENCSTAESQGYICIYTIQDLIDVNNDLTAKYILMNDIDLSSIENWIPIGKSEDDIENTDYFSGEFNGNNYSVQNMKMNIEDNDEDYDYYYLGLFGASKEALFENVGLDGFNMRIKSRDYSTAIGSLTGESNNSTFKNIKIKDFSFESNYEDLWVEFVGGISGISRDDVYEDITLKDISIIATDFIGGITGLAENINIKNMYGNITIKGHQFVAGITGLTEGSGVTSIENVDIEVNISAVERTQGDDVSDSMIVGGLIGLADVGFKESSKFSLKNVKTKGSISANSYAGGLIGEISNDSDRRSSNGYLINISIENSSSNVDFYNSPVLDEYDYIGGLIGYYEIGEYASKVKLILYDVFYNGKIYDVPEDLEDLDINPLFNYKARHFSGDLVSLENVYWNKAKNPDFIPFEKFNLGK